MRSPKAATSTAPLKIAIPQFDSLTLQQDRSRRDSRWHLDSAFHGHRCRHSAATQGNVHSRTARCGYDWVDSGRWRKGGDHCCWKNPTSPCTTFHWCDTCRAHGTGCIRGSGPAGIDHFRRRSLRGTTGRFPVIDLDEVHVLDRPTAQGTDDQGGEAGTAPATRIRVRPAGGARREAGECPSEPPSCPRRRRRTPISSVSGRH